MIDNIIIDIENAKYDTSSIDVLAIQILPALKSHIDIVSSRVVSKITTGDLSLSKQAFQIRVNSIVKYALNTYLQNRKWENNTKLYPYLLKTISRFGESVLTENSFESKNNISQHICPACKEYKMREVLSFDGVNFICNNCNLKIDDVNKEITNCNDSTKLDYLEKKLYFIKTFSKHSKTGVRCPDCKRFVPESCYIGDFLICPYPKCNADCTYAETMKHPVQCIKQNSIDIDFKPKFLEGSNYSGLFCSENQNAFIILRNEEDLVNKTKIINSVIEMQKLTQCNLRKMPNKYCMYQAFQNVLEKHTEDMVKYITLGGQREGVSIQSLIYQEFGRLIEERFPICFFTKGKQVLIDNPLDERLHLYDGMHQFSNYIDQYGVIKKKIQYKLSNETFEKIPSKEDSFIAKIISIEDQYGNDLINHIDEYNFSSIKMKNFEKTKPGTILTVKYYSIRPNYTLGSMIYVQRIKKKLMESSNRKLNTLNDIKIDY
jgi:ribosomal protein L32